MSFLVSFIKHNFCLKMYYKILLIQVYYWTKSFPNSKILHLDFNLNFIFLIKMSNNQNLSKHLI